MAVFSQQLAVGSWQSAVGSRQSIVRSTQSTRLRFATDGQADGQAVSNQRFVVDGFQFKIGRF